MEEYKVGEVFQFGKKKLKCVESDIGDCEGCAINYYGITECASLRPIIGDCLCCNRSDNKSVVFVEVIEEDNGKI